MNKGVKRTPGCPGTLYSSPPFRTFSSYVEDDVMAEIPNPFLLSPCPTVSAWDSQAMANGHIAKVVPDASPNGQSWADEPSQLQTMESNAGTFFIL